MLNCSLSHRIMTETKVCDKDTFAIYSSDENTKTQRHKPQSILGKTRREKAEDIVPAL